MTYEEFLANKGQCGINSGFKPVWIPDFLFDFQKDQVEWKILKGRGATLADCVAGETLIHCLDGDSRADELQASTILSMNGPTNASASWINGYGEIYEVITNQGLTIRVAKNHRFMTPHGWKRLGQLSIGSHLLLCDASHLRSISECALSIQREDVLNSERIIPSSKDDCLPCFRPCDGQPQSLLRTSQSFSPLQACVRERNLYREHSDGTGIAHKYNHQHQYTSPLAKPDSIGQPGTCFSAGAVCQADTSIATHPCNVSQSSKLSEDRELLPLPICGSREYPFRRMLTGDHVSYWDTVTAIRYIRHDFFYDLNVPNAGHYLANCFWSHNCGLGKTPMQLVWAENIVRKTNKRLIGITPLGVTAQTISEGAKFGVECNRSSDGKPAGKITITNYQQLHKFDPSDYVGAFCDESSILKMFGGATQSLISNFMSKMPYRALYTATAAPNDYIELGTSSEALGELGRMDMLGQFFRNDENSLHPIWWGARWQFKAHAEEFFWRWVCSWARAFRKPSDLGYDDGAFKLPPLEMRETIVQRHRPLKDELFVFPAQTIQEQRLERRETIQERCEMMAKKAAEHPVSLIFCHYNEEGHLLEKLIPNSKNVEGANSDEEKEEAFRAFANGGLDKLISKQSLAGFGLNFQRCAHVGQFPSHSFEQGYQGIRRCWRFGQKNPVTVDIVTTQGEIGVLKNFQRKSEQADLMFAKLVTLMSQASKVNRINHETFNIQKPLWLQKNK